jgi:hypothetical protein
VGSPAYEQLMKVANVIRSVKHAPELVAEKAAPKIAELIEAQYRNGLDPYGVPWAGLRPSTLERHGPPPLTDSGDMRAASDAVSAGTQIIATAPSPAEFHQGGAQFKTHHMPARPILPNDMDGLPRSWELAIEVAEQEIEAEIQAQINAA